MKIYNTDPIMILRHINHESSTTQKRHESIMLIL